jgi:hypothetical protein
MDCPGCTVKVRIPDACVHLAVVPKTSSTFAFEDDIGNTSEFAVCVPLRPARVIFEKSEAARSTVQANDNVSVLDAPGCGVLCTIDEILNSAAGICNGDAYRPYPSVALLLSIEAAGNKIPASSLLAAEMLTAGEAWACDGFTTVNEKE